MGQRWKRRARRGHALVVCFTVRIINVFIFTQRPIASREVTLIMLYKVTEQYYTLQLYVKEHNRTALPYFVLQFFCISLH